MKLNIIVFGLSITSSWGNGHAVTYRALLKALAKRGHQITFLERETPWYRRSRDLTKADYCRIELYESLRELPGRFGAMISGADLVIIGSFVPDGAVIGDWITTNAHGVTAFYDIDTPNTLAGLEQGLVDYLTPRLIPRFNLYLSFTGGTTLRRLEREFGSPCARALYCTADLDEYKPLNLSQPWSLGYLGTYSKDRQPALDRMLVEPARRLPDRGFVLAGAQYPARLRWPRNITHLEHAPPQDHPAFYGQQRFTLNVTRASMAAAGFSPSVRLFEAAACGVPVISDPWDGLETFFTPGKEILVANTTEDVLRILLDMAEEERRRIAAAARKHFMNAHTPAHRARELEAFYVEQRDESPRSRWRRSWPENDGSRADADTKRLR